MIYIYVYIITYYIPAYIYIYRTSIKLMQRSDSIRRIPCFFLAGTNQKVDATFHHMTTKEKMHVRWKNAERNGGFMSKSRSLAAEKLSP